METVLSILECNVLYCELYLQSAAVIASAGAFHIDSGLPIKYIFSMTGQFPTLHMLMLSLHVPRGMQPLVELRPLLSGISLPDCPSWLAYTLSGIMY